MIKVDALVSMPLEALEERTKIQEIKGNIINKKFNDAEKEERSSWGNPKNTRTAHSIHPRGTSSNVKT